MASRGGKFIIPLILAIMVTAVDAVIRTFVFKQTIFIPYHLIVALLVLVTSGAIVQGANKIMGALFFGALYLVVALILGLAAIEIYAMGFYLIYGAVIAFVVALLSPRIITAGGR